MKQVLKCMGLLFLMIGMLGVPLSASAQKNVRITLDETDITIAKALELLERQSGYNFIYNKDIADFNAKVTVRFKNENLAGALDKLFDGKGISYEINDR